MLLRVELCGVIKVFLKHADREQKVDTRFLKCIKIYHKFKITIRDEGDQSLTIRQCHIQDSNCPESHFWENFSFAKWLPHLAPYSMSISMIGYALHECYFGKVR